MSQRPTDSLDPYRGLPILDGLRGRELRELERCGRVVHIPEGWAIIHERESPDNAYLLLEGRARVDVRREQVADLGPGDLAGEMGLVSRSPRTASVTALSPVVALVFPTADFTAVRAAAPTFADRVDAVVAERQSASGPSR
jgi:CRP/FNR family cyclic AMP-dependent transcriptional regulator